MPEVIPVVCGLVIEDNKVLLTLRNDPKSRYHNHWQLPGGKVHDDESPYQAIVREMKEETGYDVRAEYVLPYIHHNIISNVNYVLIGMRLSIIGGSPTADDKETAAIKWYALSEISSLQLIPGTKEFVDSVNTLHHTFEELCSVLQKSRKNCPWQAEQTLDKHKEEFFSEAKEVIAAIEKKDYENLKDELGDVIWDALMIALIAEERHLFKVKDSLQSIIDKMKRRKPYIFDGTKVTKEEATKIWNEAKAREKNDHH